MYGFKTYVYVDGRQVECRLHVLEARVEEFIMYSDDIYAYTDVVKALKRYAVDVCYGRLDSCIEQFVRKAFDVGIREFWVRGASQFFKVEVSESGAGEYRYY